MIVLQKVVCSHTFYTRPFGFKFDEVTQQIQGGLPFWIFLFYEYDVHVGYSAFSCTVSDITNTELANLFQQNGLAVGHCTVSQLGQTDVRMYRLDTSCITIAWLDEFYLGHTL